MTRSEQREEQMDYCTNQGSCTASLDSLHPKEEKKKGARKTADEVLLSYGPHTNRPLKFLVITALQRRISSSS